MSAQVDAIMQAIRSTELRIDALDEERNRLHHALDTFEEARSAVLRERLVFRDHLSHQRKKIAALGTFSNVAVASRLHIRMQGALGSNMEAGVENEFADYVGNIDACIAEAEEKLGEVQRSIKAAEAKLEEQRRALQVEMAREAEERAAK